MFRCLNYKAITEILYRQTVLSLTVYKSVHTSKENITNSILRTCALFYERLLLHSLCQL